MRVDRAARYIGRPPVRVPSPQERLARLRAALAWLGVNRTLGARVRETLLDLGCEVWPPSFDERWRSWIGDHGSEHARQFLGLLDQAIVRRAAQRDECQRPE